jgi:hypothetical protein
LDRLLATTQCWAIQFQSGWGFRKCRLGIRYLDQQSSFQEYLAAVSKPETESLISRDNAWQMYLEWRDNKVPKSLLEQQYMGISQAHGKRFTSVVRQYFGIDTEKQHPMAVENHKLKEILRRSGIDPDIALKEFGRNPSPEA